MNTIARTLILSFLPAFLFSQVQIGGTINKYAGVQAIDPCLAKLTVTDASGFATGMPVLLIQMKGASINTSNSGSFGTIDELGTAGAYEINEIQAVNGNEVFLKYQFLKAYSPGDGLQLVTIPKYSDAEVVEPLTAEPWDGEKGGVLILMANHLKLQADIDVSGKGFKGGEKMLVTSGCSFFTNADDFHYDVSNWRGSPKGEGIAALVQGKEHGRGAQANGGGGGNDHNSGGGGGGHMTAGGIGGKQSSPGFGCDGDYPGRGGKPCMDLQDRIYLGGGGGAGHFDNDGAGSSGGNGGGIVMILVESIETNGFRVLANGASADLAPGDGGGGGGAGGTILLSSNNFIGDLALISNGGKGGDTYNAPDRCNGAGGGGAGGRIIANVSGSLTFEILGGEPGVNTVASGECNGPSNGAEKGSDGIVQAVFDLQTAQTEVNTTFEIQQQPENALGCLGNQLDFSIEAAGNYLTYQWQFNSGNGWEDIPNNASFVGAKTPNLTVNSPAPSMDGLQFRCLALSPCFGEIASEPAILTIVDEINDTFQAIPLGNGAYQFQNNSLNGTSFHWDFGDGTTSTETAPEHSYTDFGIYTVTLLANGPCGEDEYSLTLNVNTSPTAGFSFINTGTCAPQSAQFSNLSSNNATGFEWFFPGGTPATSTATSPSITYNTAGTYDVVLIATNAVGSDTFLLSNAIEVGGVPQVNFDLSVSNLTVNFNNLSLSATQGYHWDFGDGSTSDEQNPSHTYASQAIYPVTLTAFNDCGEASYSIDVPTGSLPLAQFSADHFSGCAPFFGKFENLSVGIGINELLWEFPGGSPATSNEPNPTVVYSEPGNYTVKLTATNQLGSHTIELADFIHVFQSPAAEFVFEIDGYSVNFINNSVASSDFTWDFGDGHQSQEPSPTHTYDGAGTYSVMLTASNLNCGSAIAYPVYLQPLADEEAQQIVSAMSIFPNPFSEVFEVRIESVKTGNLRLLDYSGKLLKSMKVGEGKTVINMAEQASGLYFFEVQNGDTILVSKVIKL
ncbi:MAG: PKD domain-containing protein, partial [Saprospiraceae bacterium]|nr:PKD domain-containing protein [Saprospiraceae bacterium]